MTTITLAASRGYQDIGTVGQTTAQLAGNVQSINQILDVGLRNTTDYLRGWIRVEDLVELGVATLDGDKLTYTGGGGGGTTFTAIDSIALSSGNLSLVNDSATPGNTMFYGTNGSGALGWYALASYSGTVTSVGLSAGSSDIVVTGATPITSSGAWSIDLSATVKTDLGLAVTALQTVTTSGAPLSGAGTAGSPLASAVENMESAGWNSSAGAVQIALTVPQDLIIPYNGTLNQVAIVTQGGAGSCTITLQKAANLGLPSVDMTNGNNPTISGGTGLLINAATLASQGWTTSLSANDRILVTLTANAGFTSVKIILRMQ